MAGEQVNGGKGTNVMCRVWLSLLLLTLATPVSAQERSGGRTAETSVGEVGQRQRRDEAAPHLKPMVRIPSRIQNRVQSRIHNRLDRYYDPQSNAASPFEVAGEQGRKAGGPNRR